MSELQASLSIRTLPDDCFFGVYEIKDAISKLKTNKKYGGFGLSSNHVINASDECFVYSAFLLTMTIAHGMPSGSFKTCIRLIVPIPKRRYVNESDSANYCIGHCAEFLVWQDP
jgi:hypothetical protein